MRQISYQYFLEDLPERLPSRAAAFVKITSRKSQTKGDLGYKELSRELANFRVLNNTEAICLLVCR
jgi:hypothetical protein